MAFRFVEEDPTEIQEQPHQQPQNEPQSFRFVDEDEPPSPQKKNSNPFAVPKVSPEQFKAMSLSERNQYAQDLEKELEYEGSKSYTKNFASGLTFGATENIEGLKPEEGEDPYAAFHGQAAGATLPITLIGKGVGYGLKGAEQAVKHGPKILKYLNNFAHGFGTGAIYESGKQGVNAVAGKEVDLSQIPITASTFGGASVLIQAAGDIGRRFMKFSPEHQAQILEQRIIPSDLPKSQYETAQEMIKLMNEGQQSPFRNAYPTGELPIPGGSPSLRNRVSPSGENVGLRPVNQPVNPEPIDQVGNLFSANRFYNTTQGGHAFRNEIMGIDENVYRGVNELYRRSRELNSAISEIHPQLVGRLQNRIEELARIPEPSDVQRRLLRASQNIVDELATFENILDEDGNVIGRQITGYQPINNQTLIDQVQSLRQIIDYDFAHGNTKNIFRPLINELQESALSAAQSSGTPEAATAINEARNAYRMWVEAFDNDYVRPFRDASNQDYSKLFKSALDLDESNMLRRILNTTPRGQELINASTREIVEKNLGKYFENPRSVKPREFDRAVRELEAVITPEQAQEVRDLFREASRRPNYRANQRVHQPSNEEIIAGKYLNKKPEEVTNLMNSRSGIKELREDFSKTEPKRKLFDTLSKQKMKSVLRDGNIEKEFTGDDLYRFLNKEHNYEIFSELLGESETESLRQAAKEIGKQQVKSEVRKKTFSKAVNKVAAVKLLDLLLGIL